MIPETPRRTIPVTLLGVAAILAGGLGSLFSAFALLMAIGKPYANSASDPPGIFLIFILPPVTLLAGICLLLRHRWARWWMILLAIGLVGLGAKGLITPTHENPAHAPIPGPAADALRHTAFTQSAAGIALGSLVLLILLSPRARHEFSRPAKGLPPALPPMPSASARQESGRWRVGHRGRDMMYYEECHGGTWRRINIDGEMLTGRAHHVIYFADAVTWSGYPEWARHRREEIIGRIKSRFREPDYEYHESTASLPRPAITTSPAAANPTAGPRGGILPVILFFLSLAAGSFWHVARAVGNGKSWLPAKHTNITVTLAEDPVLFWTAVSTIAGFGAACAGFAAWIVWTTIRRK